jgi:hypothetical protein
VICVSIVNTYRSFKFAVEEMVGDKSSRFLNFLFRGILICNYLC